MVDIVAVVVGFVVISGIVVTLVGAVWVVLIYVVGLLVVLVVVVGCSDVILVDVVDQWIGAEHSLLPVRQLLQSCKGSIS